MKFKFVNGPNSGSELEFRLSEITIGRDDCNILQLLTGGVSRYHASLKQTADRGWVIYDQNSTNGVKVNGYAISGEKIVFDGDIITIGEQQLELSGLNFELPKVEFQPIHTANTIISGHEVPVVQTAPGTSVQSSDVRETPKNANPDKLLEELKKAGSGLFNNKKEQQDSAADTNSNQEKNTREKIKYANYKSPRSIVFNAVFVIALIVCIFAGITVFRKNSSAPAAKAATVANSRNDLTLHYERIFYQAASPLSTLRMELLIENGTVTCTLDDIVSNRHMVKKISAEDAETLYGKNIDLLTQQLSASGIFENKHTPAVEPAVITVCHRMTVACNGKFTSQIYYSDDTSSQFDQAQEAIISFLEQLGLSTTLQTREELEKAAADHMREAEYSMENYLSDLSRLLDATRNFQAAIDCYEQFQPPHPNLKEARRKLATVKKLRIDKVNELRNDFDRLHRLRDMNGMATVCKEIMKIAGTQSRIYRKASDNLHRIRQIQLNQKRSGK